MKLVIPFTATINLAATITLCLHVLFKTQMFLIFYKPPNATTNFSMDEKSEIQSIL